MAEGKLARAAKRNHKKLGLGKGSLGVAHPYGQLDAPARALHFGPHLVGAPVTSNARPDSRLIAAT